MRRTPSPVFQRIWCIDVAHIQHADPRGSHSRARRPAPSQARAGQASVARHHRRRRPVIRASSWLDRGPFRAPRSRDRRTAPPRARMCRRGNSPGLPNGSLPPWTTSVGTPGAEQLPRRGTAPACPVGCSGKLSSASTAVRAQFRRGPAGDPRPGAAAAGDDRQPGLRQRRPQRAPCRRPASSARAPPSSRDPPGLLHQRDAHPVGRAAPRRAPAGRGPRYHRRRRGRGRAAPRAGGGMPGDPGVPDGGVGITTLCTLLLRLTSSGCTSEVHAVHVGRLGARHGARLSVRVRRGCSPRAPRARSAAPGRCCGHCSRRRHRVGPQQAGGGGASSGRSSVGVGARRVQPGVPAVRGEHQRHPGVDVGQRPRGPPRVVPPGQRCALRLGGDRRCRSPTRPADGRRAASCPARTRTARPSPSREPSAGRDEVGLLAGPLPLALLLQLPLVRGGDPLVVAVGGERCSAGRRRAGGRRASRGPSRPVR